MSSTYVPCPLCRQGFVGLGTSGPLLLCDHCKTEFERKHMGARCTSGTCRRGAAFVCLTEEGWRVRCDQHADGTEKIAVTKTSSAELRDVALRDPQGTRGRGKKRRRARGHGYSGGDGFVEID